MGGQENIRPAGPAAIASRFLEQSAAADPGRNLADRQLAAWQGIGWALLALGDQVADAADAGIECREELARIVAAVDGLWRPPLPVQARAAAARLVFWRKQLIARGRLTYRQLAARLEAVL